MESTIADIELQITSSKSSITQLREKTNAVDKDISALNREVNRQKVSIKEDLSSKRHNTPTNTVVNENTHVKSVWPESRQTESLQEIPRSMSHVISNSTSPSHLDIRNNEGIPSNSVNNNETASSFVNQQGALSHESNNDGLQNGLQNATSIPVVTSNRPRPPRHTNKSNTGSEDNNDFRGVINSKKRQTVRYYVGDINSSSTENAIIKYLNKKGVKPTFLSLRPNKKSTDVLGAKLHVYAEDAVLVESIDFWPAGVYIRPWKVQ